LGNQIFLRIVKQIYSRYKYAECKIRFSEYVDKSLISEILGFSWWNLFGSIAAISVTQVRGLLLNMFFGVQINAADGISRTASSQVNMVSASMTKALNPQLVKSEGSGDRDRMIYLTEISTKFSVFLFALFAVPVILETSYLLSLWLVKVPQFAVIFCQLILVGLLLDKFTFEITAAIRAVGKIREFQVSETIIILFNIPIGYLILKLGYPPYAIFYVDFFIVILCMFVRFYFGYKIASISCLGFLKNGVLPTLIPIGLGIFFGILPKMFLSENFLRLVLTTGISLFVMIFTFWIYGLENKEKVKIQNIIFAGMRKIYLQKG